MATTSKTKKEKYIRQRRDGRWEARIKVGEKADGSPDIPSRYFSTRTEARAYVKAILDARARGEIRRRSGITLGEWCDKCLEMYGHTLQDYTYTGYASKIKHHIKPAPIAKMPLEDIRRADLQAWINGLHRVDARKGSGPLSPKSVRLTMGVMTWLLTSALDAEILTTIPNTQKMRLPQTRKPNLRILDPSDVKRLLAFAQTENDYPAYLIEAATGLRRSELLGLCWDCVNLDTGAYKVRRKVALDRETKRPVLTDVLKSPSAMRGGILPNDVLAQLKIHRSRQLQQRIKAGAIWHDHNLIFPDALGFPRNPAAFSAALGRLGRKALGRHVGSHAFRHMLSTALINAGVSDPAIAEALGHRSADFTRHQYADVYDSGRRAVADVSTGLIGELIK